MEERKQGGDVEGQGNCTTRDEAMWATDMEVGLGRRQQGNVGQGTGWRNMEGPGFISKARGHTDQSQEFLMAKRLAKFHSTSYSFIHLMLCPVNY